MLTEKDCGIIERIFEGPKAKAIFKHRYSDFIVKEISLTNETSTQSNVIINPICHKCQNEDLQLDINEIFDSDQLLSLERLLSGDIDKISLSVSKKEQRGAIHKALRYHYKGKLVSDYLNDSLVIQCRDKKIKSDIRNRQINRHPVLRFVMTKENVDTMEAIEIISHYLHVKPKEFGFAGTKDKRGISSQFVTARLMTPEKLAGFNGIHLKSKIKISNIEPAIEMLKLGSLNGNCFEVILRNLQNKENTPAGLFSLKINGFINYFGLQRFGHSGTHLVGSALLSKDWIKAIDLIMNSSETREDWKTKDKKELLESLPKRCVAERKILHHLVQNGNNDFQGAIGAIPRELRLMYLHAVQSWVWNRVATKRMSLPPEKRYYVKAGMDLVEDNDGSIRTAEESDSIHQVVLPLPGYNVKYPEELKENYKEALAELNLTFDDFDEKEGNQLWNLNGGYRKLMCRPQNMSNSYLYYDNPDDEVFDISKQKSQYNLIGLKLCFALPASSYATMLIRDIIDF